MCLLLLIDLLATSSWVTNMKCLLYVTNRLKFQPIMVLTISSPSNLCTLQLLFVKTDVGKIHQGQQLCQIKA